MGLYLSPSGTECFGFVVPAKTQRHVICMSFDSLFPLGEPSRANEALPGNELLWCSHVSHGLNS